MNSKDQLLSHTSIHLFSVLQQNTQSWLIYKKIGLLAHSSRGWKSKIGGLICWTFGEVLMTDNITILRVHEEVVTLWHRNPEGFREQACSFKDNSFLWELTHSVKPFWISSDSDATMTWLLCTQPHLLQGPSPQYHYTGTKFLAHEHVGDTHKLYQLWKLYLKTQFFKVLKFF
jgi:hypothetical protein